MSDQKVMPSGSMPPPPEEEPGKGVSQEPQAPAQAPAQAPESQGEAAKLLGKFDSPEALAKAYQELESAHGRQSSEIGDLRKTKDVLLTQLEQNQKMPGQQSGKREAPPKEAPPDYDAQITDIASKVDQGELDIAEALKLTSNITTAKALSMANEQFTKANQAQQAKMVQDQFLKDHPDFMQLQQDGTLQSIMQSNPLHDQFSAYWAYQADQQSQAKDLAAQEAYEKGKSEVQKLAEGTKVAEKVLSSPGSTMRQSNPQGPLTPKQVRASMHQVVSKLSGGAG